MLKLSEAELSSLNAAETAQRIDEFFREDYESRYRSHGSYHEPVPAARICESAKFQALDVAAKKRALLVLFRARFQIALCNQYFGYENATVHDAPAGNEKWQNPHVQIQYASLRQAATIASRTAFESLMEFLYLVEEQQSIPGAKSKIHHFVKWCIRHQSQYGWLVFYMITLYRFDRKLRTPEIHGFSSMAMEALLCLEWPHSDSELDAIDVFLNIWGAILETLNNRPVSSWSSKPDQPYMESFMKWQTLDLNELWRCYAELT